MNDAHSAYRAGRLENAKSLYLAVLRDDPENAEAHHRLATIADRDRDFSTARRHYRAALESNPINADLLSDMGWSSFLQGQYKQSELTLKQALKIDPNNQRAMHNLAWLYGHQNQRDRAYSLFLRTGSDQHAQKMMAQLDASTARKRVDPVSSRNIGLDTRSTLQAPDPRSTTPASRDRRSHSGNESFKDIRRLMQRKKELAIARRQQRSRLSASGADSRQVGYRNRIGDLRGATGSTLRSDRRSDDSRYGGSISSERNPIQGRREFRDSRYPQRPASDGTLNDRMRQIDIAANRKHRDDPPYPTGNPRYSTEQSGMATNRGSRSGTNRAEIWPPEDPRVIHSHFSGSASRTDTIQPAIRQKPVRRNGTFDDRNTRRASGNAPVSGAVDPVHREALRLGHNTGAGGVPFPIPGRRASTTSPTHSQQKAVHRDGPDSRGRSRSTSRQGGRGTNIDVWPPSRNEISRSTDSSPVSSYRNKTDSSNDFDEPVIQSGPVIRPRTTARYNSRYASPDTSGGRYRAGYAQSGGYSGN